MVSDSNRQSLDLSRAAENLRQILSRFETGQAAASDEPRQDNDADQAA